MSLVRRVVKQKLACYFLKIKTLTTMKNLAFNIYLQYLAVDFAKLLQDTVK